MMIDNPECPADPSAVPADAVQKGAHSRIRPDYPNIPEGWKQLARLTNQNINLLGIESSVVRIIDIHGGRSGHTDGLIRPHNISIGRWAQPLHNHVG